MNNQPYEAENFNDKNQNPAGGFFKSIGVDIRWQNGPLGRDAGRLEPNGAFVETVLTAAKQRLEYYQASKFESHYNAIAIVHIQAALDVLQARTADRENRKVEGTHEQ